MQCTPRQRSVRFGGAARCLWRISGDQPLVGVSTLTFPSATARIREAARVGAERDRGANVIAPALCDRAMEVTWTGVRQMIAAPAAQEDIRLMAVSVVSGARTGIASRATHLLHDRGFGDVLVV